MIIDSSVIVAILLEEQEAESLSRAMGQVSRPQISQANWLEASMVVYSRLGEYGLTRLDRLMEVFSIERVSVGQKQADLARQAFITYGKGNHPAALNFGDCFAYALSKENAQPLLFKGDDFRQTDVQVVEF